MAKKGFEGGEFEGLGWFNASVVKISPKSDIIKVPNIGWNKIDYNKENILFQNLKDPSLKHILFTHTTWIVLMKNIIATSIYDHRITAAVNKNNICGTKFHPEKSQDLGLQI